MYMHYANILGYYWAKEYTVIIGPKNSTIKLTKEHYLIKEGPCATDIEPPTI